MVQTTLETVHWARRLPSLPSPLLLTPVPMEWAVTQICELVTAAKEVGVVGVVGTVGERRTNPTVLGMYIAL